MTVILCTSGTVPPEGDFDFCCAIDPTTDAGIDPANALPGLTAALENAVNQQVDVWSNLARILSSEPSAQLAHAPHCASNASDLGLMLGWRHLVESWIGETLRIVVICDDPWMFRELASLGITVSGTPPTLIIKELTLTVRGMLARTRVALRVFSEARRFASGVKSFPAETSVLLVYGHPASTSQGADGYFGDLMNGESAPVRLLHVDCVDERARALVDNRRTFSLHGWGSALKALPLPFARWRPTQKQMTGKLGWLVRRAQALEGGTGQAAMIRWQQVCQQAWLADARPRVVAWPWENHGWERVFVRQAKSLGVRTIGYQHATVGRREWNYGNGSNIDGKLSTPETICTSGPAGSAALVGLGYDASDLTDIGALRLKTFKRLHHDPDGPVFVAVPFDAAIGNQMLAAIRPLAVAGRTFVIKVHPMTPLEFDESPGIRRTDMSLEDQPGVAAVLYAATTVGLEALLGGLPTLRFQPRGLIPTDPTPDNIDVPEASAETLATHLENLQPPPALDPTGVFSPPDLALWHKLLGR